MVLVRQEKLPALVCANVRPQPIQSHSAQFVTSHELAKAFEDDVEVCKFGRAHFCKASGAVKAFEITSATVDDRAALCDLSLSIPTGAIILADK